jgi:hypothetical protein
VLVVGAIALLARRLVDPPLPAQRPSFDVLGAVLSAVGLLTAEEAADLHSVEMSSLAT